MTPAAKFFIIDKATGQSKLVGECAHPPKITGEHCPKPPKLTGTYSFTFEMTPEQTKEMQWLLDRPNRIRKYVKQLTQFNKMSNHETIRTIGGEKIKNALSQVFGVFSKGQFTPDEANAVLAYAAATIIVRVKESMPDFYLSEEQMVNLLARSVQANIAVVKEATSLN